MVLCCRLYCSLRTVIIISDDGLLKETDKSEECETNEKPKQKNTKKWYGFLLIQILGMQCTYVTVEQYCIYM